MSIRNFILEIEVGIDAIVDKCEFGQEIYSKENLEHAYKLKNNFNKLTEQMSRIDTHSGLDNYSKINEDLKKLSILIKSQDIDEVHIIKLMEQQIDDMLKKYNLLVKEQNSRLEKIKIIKARSKRAKLQEFKERDERNERIARATNKIKNSKKLSKIDEDSDKNNNTIILTRPDEREIYTDALTSAVIGEKVKKILEEKKLKKNKENNLEINTEHKHNLEDAKMTDNSNKRVPFLEKVKKFFYTEKSKELKNISRSKSKLSWFATIPLIGAIAISFFPGTNSSDSKNAKANNTDNSYTDSIKPEDESESYIINESDFGDSNLVTQIYTSNDRYNETSTTTTEKKMETTSPSTKSLNEISIVDAEEEDNANLDISEENTTIDSSDSSDIMVCIGDKIKVSEGLRYTADCLGGGTSNCIGAVSWRPATSYSVDKVAFCYDGEILGIARCKSQDIKSELGKYSTQYGIDMDKITTSVLLSLVPGAGDTGWAPISITDLQQNLVVQGSDFVYGASENKGDADIER